jgi:hypothetical protein
MHDIDRTQLEYENAFETTEPEAFEFAGETGSEQQEWEAALHEAGLHEQGLNGEFHENEFAGEFDHEFAGDRGPAEEYAGEFQESGFESPIGETSYDTTQESGEFGEGPMMEGEFPETNVGEVGSHESVLGEAEEMELASEFLEITNDQELDQFLGKLTRCDATCRTQDAFCVGPLQHRVERRYPHSCRAAQRADRDKKGTVGDSFADDRRRKLKNC